MDRWTVSYVRFNGAANYNDTMLPRFYGGTPSAIQRYRKDIATTVAQLIEDGMNYPKWAFRDVELQVGRTEVGRTPQGDQVLALTSDYWPEPADEMYGDASQASGRHCVLELTETGDLFLTMGEGMRPLYGMGIYCQGTIGNFDEFLPRGRVKLPDDCYVFLGVRDSFIPMKRGAILHVKKVGE